MLDKFTSLFLFILFISACSSQNPQSTLSLLEENGFKQFQKELLELNFAIESKGSFVSDLKGSLTLSGLNSTELTAKGHFGNKPMNLHWKTIGDSLIMSDSIKQKSVLLSDSLTRSIWIGLIRMGLLHNLAGMTTLSPPDRMNGEVSNWVRYDSVKTLDDNSYLFRILVQNTYSGDARLWMHDSLFVFPSNREQFVNFPGGSMKVREQFWLASPSNSNK